MNNQVLTATTNSAAYTADVQTGGIELDAPTLRPWSHMRSVKIDQVNHGYMVQVGCQTLAIESKERLIEKLIAYINNPQETEEKYNQGKLF